MIYFYKVLKKSKKPEEVFRIVKKSIKKSPKNL